MFFCQNTVVKNETIKAAIVGVGSAGLDVLDRLVLSEFQQAQLVAIDTDIRALASCIAEKKIHLGRSLTHGLDTGGDPELGRRAAILSSDEFLHAIADAQLVFFLAGLGGGTGTGAIPELLRFAQQRGTKTVCLLTLPFDFEGPRKKRQAKEGINLLLSSCDAVFAFPNSSVLSILDQLNSVYDAFQITDDILAQVSRGLCYMLSRSGFLSLEWSHLVKILQPSLQEPEHACWVGWGEDATKNRAQASVEMILRGPFLGRQEIRSQADEILINIIGGSNLLFCEIETVVQKLREEFADDAHIRIAISQDDRKGEELSVLVIAAKTKTLYSSSTEISNRSNVIEDFTSEQCKAAAEIPPDAHITIDQKPVMESFSVTDLSSTQASQVTEKTYRNDPSDSASNESQQTIDNITESKFQQLSLSSKSLLEESNVATKVASHESQEKQERPIPQNSVIQKSHQGHSGGESFLRQETKNFFGKPSHKDELSDLNSSTELNPTSHNLPEIQSAPGNELITKSLTQSETQPIEWINKIQKTQEHEHTSLQEFFQNSPFLKKQTVQLTEQTTTPFPGSQSDSLLKADKKTELPREIAHPLQKQTQKRSLGFQQILESDIKSEFYFTHEPEQDEPVTPVYSQPRQQDLPLESSTGGRFDDTEVTIYNGENLDIPTFLRKGYSIREVVD